MPAPSGGEEALFAAALEKPESERVVFLETACPGNPDLVQRLLALLAADMQADPGLATLEDAARTQRRESEPPEEEDAVGQTLGRYRLLEKIGEGGCGVVYVAEQSHPVRRRVALKVIKLGMDSKGVVARFEAERQALAMMDHPHIAKVFDAGTSERGRPYFLMELVRGVPITDFCDQEELPTGERLELFIQVCKAIQHAHQKGIIHRDIKPSNILVTWQDGIPVPKVIDFGIAKAIEGRLTDATVHTQVNHFLGTPAYMSPEQAEMSPAAAGDVDTRSDIYSLGVLLYELLTGQTPFNGHELLALGIDGMRKTIREKVPPRPSTRLTQKLVAGEVGSGRSTISLPTPPAEANSAAGRLRLKEQITRIRGDLDWIVMKCLEKDRNRRYETAAGLAADIQRHLQNEPVTAGPPSKAYIFKKFIARHRWPMVAYTTIALLILVGFIGTSIGLKRATVARIQADQNAAHASRLASAAQASERAARVAQSNALRQAYSASMLSLSDALERGRIDAVQHYLDSVPTDLRGWEWRHFSSHLDLSIRNHDYPRTWGARLLVLPDGQSYYDICDSPAGGIHRRHLATGELLKSLPTGRTYSSLQLLAGEKQLLANVRNGSGEVLERWDLERETLLSSQPIPGQLAATTSDGSRVAYLQDGRIHILDLISRVTRRSKATADSGASCFQPDGRRLAFSPAFGQVALMDTDSLQTVAVFEAHRNAVSALAISPDGRWLASGSLDSTIRITDIAVHPPLEVATLRRHAGLVLALCFSPDGSLLASSDTERNLRLWDVRTRSLRAALQTDGFDPSFLPDGRTLVNGHANGVRFWDLPALDATVLRGHGGHVHAVLLSPDGSTVYSGGWDGFVGQPGSLRFWDAATGDEVAATGAADEYVRAAELSTDGSRLAISLQAANGASSRIDILDTATGTKVASIAELGENLASIRLDSLAFDPDARRLVWVAPNPGGVVRLADARTGVLQKSRPLLGPNWPGTSSRVAWSSDGATIAVYNGGGPMLELLDAESLETLRRWPHGSAPEWDHSRPIRSLSFSPDNRRLITASEDGIAKVWDVATGTLLHNLVGHSSRVLCAAYSPDGKRIASGGDDFSIRIWDAETFDPVARLAGHEDRVYALAWRADSEQVVSGSADNAVRLWGTESVKARAQARRERQTILAQVEPMVQRLFAELGDARKVVEQIKADSTLGTRSRQVALQVVLRTSLARQKP